jgi:hypothetical protein
MFEARQAEFRAALLTAEPSVPRFLTSPSPGVPAKRFAIYRNNFVVSLTEVLAAGFPAVLALTGDEFFRAAARVFILAHPPRSPVLSSYGGAFPKFLSRFPPASELPYLPGVAEIEVARTRAYHAADAIPLSATDLAGVPAEAVAGLRIAVHPSFSIVRSPYPIVTIWGMNSGAAAPRAIETRAGEDALIWRRGHDVCVQRLRAGGAAFLGGLSSGATMAEAAAAAIAGAPDFDLTLNLAGLIGAGLICGLDPQGADNG